MQTPPKPVRALWIPWPLAVVLVPLFWLLPKRMGPHFAAVRWPGVIVAHLVWVVYGLGCMTVAYWTPLFGWVAYLTGRTSGRETEALWPDPTFSQIARAPMAVLGSLLAGNPEFGVNGWVGVGADLAIGLAMAVAVEAGLILLACLLMPYATAGERGQLLFSRSVKLTLWSTTSLPVLGIAFQAIELLNYTRKQLDELWAGAIGLYILWFVWIWLRSGLRYAGPTEGPAWEPRRPLCETCGYALTGLKPADNCPECGTAVALSLPERRRPTAFSAARSLIGRPIAFVRTWRDALRWDFHRRLEIGSEYPTARRFAIVMCIVGGLLPQPTILADVILNVSRNRGLEGWADFVAPCIGIGLAFLLVLSVLILASGVSGNGSIRRAAPIVFYWSAWFIPLIAAVYLSLGLMYVIKKVLRIRREVPWFPGNWPDWGDLLCAGAALLIPIVFLFAAIRLARALRETRFANG
ncbi:MAG: hypothetical protein GX616_24410 [Planctomycetes bacterium]|nr:hypothetical protein [Planctomycetota bacterium]